MTHVQVCVVQPLPPISEGRSLKQQDDDTISVYVFGEDEAELENEARENGGFLKYEHLASHYGNGTLQNVRRRRRPRVLCPARE